MSSFSLALSVTTCFACLNATAQQPPASEFGTSEEICKKEVEAATADFIAKKGATEIDETKEPYRTKKFAFEAFKEDIQGLINQWDEDSKKMDFKAVQGILNSSKNRDETNERLWIYLSETLPKARQDSLASLHSKIHDQPIDLPKVKGKRRVKTIKSTPLIRMTPAINRDQRPLLIYELRFYDADPFPQNEQLRIPHAAFTIDTDSFIQSAKNGKLPSVSLEDLKNRYLGDPPAKRGKQKDHISRWLEEKRLSCPQNMKMSLNNEKINPDSDTKHIQNKIYLKPKTKPAHDPQEQQKVI